MYLSELRATYTRGKFPRKQEIKAVALLQVLLLQAFQSCFVYSDYKNVF